VIEDKIKILYADDDPDDREMFQEALAKLNLPHQLTFACNGLEAIELLQNSIPDIIFLDINMPLKCGVQSLAEIRSDKRFMNIPVIIVSTSANKTDIDKIHQAGANLYALKQPCFDQHVKLLRLVLAMYQNMQLRDLSRQEYFISDPEKVNRNMKISFS
jgi:CheY-like chemotaxis protein